MSTAASSDRVACLGTPALVDWGPLTALHAGPGSRETHLETFRLASWVRLPFPRRISELGGPLVSTAISHVGTGTWFSAVKTYLVSGPLLVWGQVFSLARMPEGKLFSVGHRSLRRLASWAGS